MKRYLIKRVNEGREVKFFGPSFDVWFGGLGHSEFYHSWRKIKSDLRYQLSERILPVLKISEEDLVLFKLDELFNICRQFFKPLSVVEYPSLIKSDDCIDLKDIEQEETIKVIEGIVEIIKVHSRLSNLRDDLKNGRNMFYCYHEIDDKISYHPQYRTIKCTEDELMILKLSEDILGFTSTQEFIQKIRDLHPEVDI